MCVSLKPAHFSKTKGLAAETKRGRKIVHLLGYGNRAVNLAGGGSTPSTGSSSSSYGRRLRSRRVTETESQPATATGNAMLLPIPAKPRTMTSANIIDTTSCPNVLKDLERAVLPPVSRGGMRRGGVSKSVDSVDIYDHDIYTIVLAQNASDIPAALERVRADRRPSINKEIFDAYAQWYEGWTFALCCFNTAQEAEAKPMLWWYEPANKDLLFFPAIDAHDGKVPNLNAQVDVDHTIVFGSHLIDTEAARQVHYTDTAIDPAISKLLPTHVIGAQQVRRAQQGDFVISVADVRAGRFNVRRELPPGA